MRKEKRKTQKRMEKKAGINWQTRSIAGEFEAKEQDGKKVIGCYFATFDGTYEICEGLTESIDPHAFDAETTGDVRALIDHDTRLVLGRTTAGTLRLFVDSHGLGGEIIINDEDQDALNLYARVKRKDVTQCSIGFDIIAERMEEHPDGSVHYTIEKAKLYEVSIVTFPAYENTQAEARSKDRKRMQQRALDAWKEKTKGRLKKWH